MPEAGIAKPNAPARACIDLHQAAEMADFRAYDAARRSAGSESKQRG